MPKNTSSASSSSSAAAAAAAAAIAATSLATKTSEATAVIGNDINWIKTSLNNIELSLKEMKGIFIARSEFIPIKEGIDEYHKKLDQLEKIVWLGLGGLSVITFVLKFLIK